MKEIIYYKFVDKVVKVISDFEFSLKDVIGNDFITNDDHYDYEFEFCSISNINDYIDDHLTLVDQTEWCHLYKDSLGNTYMYYIFDQCYMALTILKKQKGICYYLGNQMISYHYSQGCSHFTYMRVEYIYYLFHSFILHSSHITKNHQSILFSAPSGTGKSTQAELFRLYGGYEIVNGDRTAIKRVSNQWFSYGVPVSGTSNICKNITSHLKAIIVLRQSPTISVRSLKAIEAFKCIYSELTINQWDKEFVNKAMNWIEDLVLDVPILLFECTKEKESFEYLNQYLLDNHIMEGDEVEK